MQFFLRFVHLFGLVAGTATIAAIAISQPVSVTPKPAQEKANIAPQVTLVVASSTDDEGKEVPPNFRKT